VQTSSDFLSVGKRNEPTRFETLALLFDFALRALAWPLLLFVAVRLRVCFACDETKFAKLTRS
jgi:hypothetical protein